MSSQNNAYKERILGIYLFTKIGCFGYQRDSVFSPTLKTKIEVYTNKAKGILNVKPEKPNESAALFNLRHYGKVVLKGTSNTNNLGINIQSFNPVLIFSDYIMLTSSIFVQKKMMVN